MTTRLRTALAASLGALALVGSLSATGPASASTPVATRICNGNVTAADQRMCVAATAIGSVQAIAGSNTLVKGYVSPWQVDTSYGEVTGNPKFATTVSDTVGGRTQTYAPRGTYNTKYHSGGSVTNTGYAYQISGRNYKWRQWDAVVSWRNVSDTDRSFNTTQRYSDYTCYQSYSTRSPLLDCKNGTVVAYGIDYGSDKDPVVTNAPSGLSVDLPIEKYTYKVTNGRAGTQTSLGKGTYSLRATYSGGNQTLTTSWTMGSTTVKKTVKAVMTSTTRMDVTETN